MIVFLTLFGPRILGSQLDLITITCAGYVVISFYNRRKITSYALYFIIIILFMFSILLFSGIPSTVPHLHLAKPIRVVIEFLGIFLLVKHFKDRYENNFIDKVIEKIYICIVIHAIIMCIQFYNDDFRNMTYMLTDAWRFVNVDYSINVGARVVGLTYGQSLLSVIQAIGILFLFHIRKAGKKNRKIHSIFFYFILVFSVLISGKSGLLVIVFGCFLLVLENAVRRKVLFLYLTLGIFGTLILFDFTVNQACVVFDCSDNISYIFYRLEELYAIFFQGRSVTLEHILNELTLPSTEVFWRGGEITGIDSGYMKDLYLGGFLYSLSVIAFCIISLHTILKSVVFRGLPLVFFVLALVVFVVHFKESAIFSRGIWSLLVYGISVSILINKNYSR